MSYRIGLGFDIHRLAEGRKLFLGGVEIPYIKGLLGHSDADALLHAICDAMLGAAASCDIGEHFSDKDPEYKDIPSIELLKSVGLLIKEKGFKIGNIDTIVIAEEPVLSPFKKQMQKCIAHALNIENNLVSIKAKTSEGLGEIGEKQAIACYATVLLVKED